MSQPSSPTLYTAGYGRAGWDPESLLERAEELDAIIVDIRLSPKSRIPEWRKSYLAALWGRRYWHCHDLGNVNYKGGPIVLQNPETGVRSVLEILERQSVILLCVCADVARCHRVTAAAAIANASPRPLQVVHLVPERGEDPDQLRIGG
jgi:hypothetical protein